MNKDIIQGSWKELKGKVKQQWGKLTDDEVSRLDGSYEKLEGQLQKTYGYEKDRVEKEINEFVSRYYTKSSETEDENF